jgi:hypothetical protein
MATSHHVAGAARPDLVTALLSPGGTAAHLSGAGDWRWQHRLLIVALVLVAYALVAACLWLKIRDRVPRWTVHLNIAVVVVLVSVAAAIGPGVHAETDPRMTRPNPAAIGPGVHAETDPRMTRLNPVANVAPSPDFLASGLCTNPGAGWTCDNPCVTSSLTWPKYTNGVLCTGYVLEAINVGRAAEGLAPLVLPTNWYRLTQGEQLFVVADLERTARGLPPYLGINRALSANAQRAARANGDPSIASGFAIGKDAQGVPGMGGAWSAGFTVLAADYVWMYDDGWGGSAAATSNIVCTSAKALGCWAHRDELLGYDPGYNPGVGLTCRKCEMGIGFAVVNGSGSFVDLIELPKGVPPAMTFTWAKNVEPFRKA